MSDPLLRVDDLVVTFTPRGLFRRGEGVQAVRGVSLSVEAGTTVGIVGQSGSGKSTVARTIVGLERPTSGRIVLGGRTVDQSAESLAELRRSVQMVFQDSLSSLNPRRTIGAILAEPLVVHGIVPRARIADRVSELLEDVGLPASHARRRPMQLSGGQRQRVNIARALASSPQLIIADEPTSALDVSIRAQILELLKRLQAEHGLAYLFISHDLHVVRYMSDTVVVMRHGEIVEVADKTSIYRAPQHEYTKELLAAAPTTDTALAKARARRADRPVGSAS
ncbi:ABC transporter ATP-binding protein [Curtobacterium sp. MCBD17_013]|uniref:ATP-binding cassette domain-containing protein n=1 Tax=Curtobacterium sp. MCBD17_013 TaxID=2175668 RepID=UPI000DA9DD3A|nr:ATP-binding cassette domain-containing protein [Curtobacterium sp. MCBD17_013]PZF60740.1 ABC transporter ATP-binding protein [Curtobacterium sp. MCBD17_013]